MLQPKGTLKTRNETLPERLVKTILQSFPKKRKASGLEAVEQECDVLKVENSLFPSDAFRQHASGFVG